MKKTILLLGTTLLISGCGLFGTAPQQDVSQAEQTDVSEDTIIGSIREMVGLGSSFECTAIQDGVEQVSYVKNDMFRAETKLEGHDGTTIMRDNCIWSWVINEAQGIVMCYEPGDLEIEDEHEDPSFWDANHDAIPDDVEFTCKRTSVSDDLFEPPSDVEFVNMKDAMEEMLNEAIGEIPDIEGIMEGLSAEEQEKIQEALRQFGGLGQ